ncbi:hypothetical protein Q4508_19400, partial [Amphritea sp. 2_MG-2023]
RTHDCHRTIVIDTIDPNGAVRSSPAPYAKLFAVVVGLNCICRVLGELANRTIGRTHDCHRTIVIDTIDPNGAVRSSPAPYAKLLAAVVGRNCFCREW